jgi:hypothetical protein
MYKKDTAQLTNASYQKNVYYISIKIFNNLLKCSVHLVNDKKQFVL